MIDYYYEQLNFTERRIYKSIYVSIVNKESNGFKMVLY